MGYRINLKNIILLIINLKIKFMIINHFDAVKVYCAFITKDAKKLTELLT